MKVGNELKTNNLELFHLANSFKDNEFVLFLVNSENGNIQYVSEEVNSLLGKQSHHYYEGIKFLDLLSSKSFSNLTNPEDFLKSLLELNDREMYFLHNSGNEIGVTCLAHDLSKINPNSKLVEIKLSPNLPSMSEFLETGKIFGYDKELEGLKVPVPNFVNPGSQALFITKNGICIGQNEQAAEFFGYTQEEILGLNPIDVIDPAYHDVVMENITKGKSKPYEIKALPKKGKPFFARIQGSTIDFQGDVIRLSAITKVKDKRDSDSIIESQEKHLVLKNEELESKTVFLEALNEFAIQMNTVHSEHCVLSMLLDILEQKFDIIDSVIFKFNAYNNELEEFVRKTGKEISDPFVISGFKGIVGSCAKQERPILVADTSKDKRYISDGTNGLSELAIPIIIQDKLFAVIDTEHKNKNYFTHSHIEVINALASMVASRVQDIFNQKIIAESELKHRLLFERANDSIFISKDGGWVDCNPEAMKMFECQTKMDLIGKSPFDFSPEYQPSGELSWELGSKLKEEARKGKSNSFNWIHRTKTGRDFHAHVNLNSFQVNGETYVQSVVRDISENVIVNKDLKDMADMFSKLLDTTSAVAWEYDWVNSKYNYISARIERLSGYTREEWDEPFHWESIIHPEDKAKAIDFGVTQIQNRTDYNHKYRMIKKDGSIVWVKDLVSVVYESQDSLILRGCFVDITEQEDTDRVKEDLNQKLTLKVKELDVLKSDYQEVFEESRVPLFQDDYTEYIQELESIKYKGITVRDLLTTHVDQFKYAVSKIKIIRANKACQILFQASSKEELYLRIRETITEKTKIGFAELAVGIMNGQSEFKLYNEFMGLKGRELKAEVGMLVKPNLGSNQIIAHVSVVDITERENARIELNRQNQSLQSLSDQLSENNELLIQNETRFKALFHDSPVALIEEDISVLMELVNGVRDKVHDIQAYMHGHPDFVANCINSLRTVSINKAGLKLFGVENELQLNEVMGQTINRNGAKIFKGVLTALFQGKSSAAAHNEFVTLDGAVVSSMVKYVLIPNTKRALLSFVDITDLKNIEKELVDAKIKAEESDRLKTEFLKNLSHEIRTPLNGIIGFSNLIADPNLTPEEVEEHSKIIQGSGQQLIRIIDEIIEMAKLETNQISTKEVEVSINDICQDLYSIFNLKAQQKGIDLAFHINLEKQQSLVVVDKTKLIKILSNLIQNALKFTSEGFIKLQIEMDGEFIKFSVTDSGIGIEAENQEKIFSKFVQGDDAIATTYGGLGLGLSIVKNHIELLGGKIMVNSEINVGSTFEVWLPHKSGDVKMSGAFEKSTLSLPSDSVILVAEDDRINALFLIHTLKRMNLNCQIIHAENGQKAIEMFKSTPNVSLVLMDIGMPVLNGYQATEEIKKLAPNVPVIAQTAYTSTDDREKMKEAGMDDFMAKPIDTETLKSVLNKHLSGHLN